MGGGVGSRDELTVTTTTDGDALLLDHGRVDVAGFSERLENWLGKQHVLEGVALVESNIASAVLGETVGGHGRSWGGKYRE